jgi:hypothetical protein
VVNAATTTTAIITSANPSAHRIALVWNAAATAVAVHVVSAMMTRSASAANVPWSVSPIARANSAETTAVEVCAADVRPALSVRTSNVFRPVRSVETVSAITGMEKTAITVPRIAGTAAMAVHPHSIRGAMVAHAKNASAPWIPIAARPPGTASVLTSARTAVVAEVVHPSARAKNVDRMDAEVPAVSVTLNTPARQAPVSRPVRLHASGNSADRMVAAGLAEAARTVSSARVRASAYRSVNRIAPANNVAPTAVTGSADCADPMKCASVDSANWRGTANCCSTASGTAPRMTKSAPENAGIPPAPKPRNSTL